MKNASRKNVNNPSRADIQPHGTGKYKNIGWAQQTLRQATDKKRRELIKKMKSKET